MFHFNRSHGTFNPSPLDLSPIGGPVLCPKSSWKYLGFIFDQKLTFHQHIDFYSNKAISTVKCMKLLGNSTRGINPLQKRLLYRCCILPIALDGFQLWFYNKVPLSYPMKILGKMQRKAAIWILGAFKILPMERLEAIAGLIPIKSCLHKLMGRSQLCSASLPENHLIKTLMDDPLNTCLNSLPNSINFLTDRQKTSIKGHLIDSNNKLYGVFPSFSPLNPEFIPGSRIINIFPDQFSFNLASKGKNASICSQQLDDMTIQASMFPHTAIVVSNVSIKNDITTSISHIHICDQPLVKTVHHAAFVTSTEVELFAIRCSINQACNNENISKVIVITDSIHAAKKIFNTKSHLYQIHILVIFNELRQFFTRCQDNHIEFWECSSRLRWNLHKSVDKDSKSFKPTSILPNKTSWDYCKKVNSDDIIKQWRMTFQVSDGKGRHFLNLVDDNLETVEPSYTKECSWLQSFGHSNLLCT